MTESYTLAIDLGTSAVKVALVSAAGQVPAMESEPCGLTLLPDGGAEQDPQDWWAAIRNAVACLTNRHPAARGAVSAISCTAQWSGTVAVDRSGRPLLRALIWMDSRGAPDVSRITGGRLTVANYGIDKLWRWIRKTGGIPGHTGMDSLAHILYIQRAHPHIYADAYKFLEPKDYLNLLLTGEWAASYDSIALHWVTDNRDASAVR